ncbi:MAG: amidase [Acidobacteria bacterium]|nr:amidase [Acidobacteriota bacterium]MBI3424450.1 amidase [Acidobacteriota bacterium]
MKHHTRSRRRFLQTGAQATAFAILSPHTRAHSEAAFQIEEATVNQLQDAQNSGAQSAQLLVEAYLNRIDELDKHGPAINSVIELNPDALSIADQLDAERKAGKVRGPLHGIPVLIKDNIDTHDRMMTTAGSLALEGSIAPRDAFIVEQLRKAGAVILGKTNLSEWANFRSSKSISGWSGRGGQTRNPYALDRNPCGSSSGSGAAAAANLCAVAVGTETDGSIVCPSTTNGLVGIKPTLGLVSRAGIIPIAHSQDTAGPMARTVADAAALLNALTGVDPRDALTRTSTGKADRDYTRFLAPHGLTGARLGVVRKSFGFNEHVDKLMEAAIEVMRQKGAIIIDPADIPTAGKFDASEFEVLLYEFKADLNAYLKTLGPNAPVKTIKDIIAFNEKHADRELKFFGQDTMLKAQAKGDLHSPAYRKALAKNHLLTGAQGIDAVMTKYRLDALIAPTGGPAWTVDYANGDHFTGGFSSASAVAGYPHITVPAGFVYGLPVGISFAGRAWSEPKLISLAYAFEQATLRRKPPQFLEHADLRAGRLYSSDCCQVSGNR